MLVGFACALHVRRFCQRAFPPPPPRIAAFPCPYIASLM
jgi:hypothetical protein